MADAEGPLPMKGNKPAPLNPNSADQFNSTHQGVYEARSRDGDESKDVDEVVQRNNVYPKLRNELQRRRSAVEIKACSSRRNYSHRCSACEKLRQLAELKRLRLKPKCQARRKPVVREYRRKGRVQKNKRIKKKLTIKNRHSDKRKTYKSCSNDSLRNPDTNPSVSSFNSYPSSALGREPMDS